MDAVPLPGGGELARCVTVCDGQRETLLVTYGGLGPNRNRIEKSIVSFDKLNFKAGRLSLQVPSIRRQGHGASRCTSPARSWYSR